MASNTQSSALSRYIDLLIDTTQNTADVDLQQLIKKIDDFLEPYKMNQRKIPQRKKLTLDCQTSASNAGKILEGVSKNVNVLVEEVKQISGKDHSTAIKVLGAVGTVYWAGLPLLLVAAVLQRLDTIQKNKEERVMLLYSMNELAKVVLKLKEIPSAKDEMRTQITDSIALVVQGVILCFSEEKSTWEFIEGVKRLFNATEDAKELRELGSKLEHMFHILTAHMVVHSLAQGNRDICKPPRFPWVEHAEVGIQHQVDEVVKLLQWEDDAPSLAVIVHGFGGSGKTTLAKAVYRYLTDKLPNDWKRSMITLSQDGEKNANVKELQSKILEHLNGKKDEETEVKDWREGQEKLKKKMDEKPIFLFIDNALSKKCLEELLPKMITNPKKLRLLITARKTNISAVIKGCRIESKIYPIEALPVDDAIKMLCERIAPGTDTNSLRKKTPQLNKIAEEFRSCPLFLEVVGGFLCRRSRNNSEEEAYDSVLKWMENGKHFSCDTEDRFDERRLMFAYDQLEASAQEAFLDICCFFNDRERDSRDNRVWDWEDVAHIVGEEEMICLDEGALIRRNQERSRHAGRIITKISIHDLLLSIGRHKSQGNRFRTAEEFTEASQKGKLLPAQVKGVWLTHEPGQFRGPIPIGAEVLDAMSGCLRIFAMGKWTLVEGKCSKSFDELRFLLSYPGSDLPMDLSKLSSLTYISCSWRDNIKSSELKDMPELKVVKVTDCPHRWSSNEISEVRYSEKRRVLALRGEEISDFVNLGYLRKLDLSGSRELLQLPGSLGKLTLLEELYLEDCSELKQLPVEFGKLKALAVLCLRGCRSLKELPRDFVNLSSLQRLDLNSCESLQELPSSFEKLSSLQYLNLECCSELISLPERLGELTRLTEIKFRKCEKLSSLPQSLGGLSSLLLSEMSFEICSSLTELPEETSWLSRMTDISFEGCSSLKRIPSQFSKLGCLEKLSLRGCTGLEELWNDFHHLDALRILQMSGCTSLSTLPRGFGKLKSLKSLDLFGCDKLEELCDDFHHLEELEWLNLSRCHSLTKLSDGFGKLKSLKSLDLSDCDELKELCDDFQLLEKLEWLDLHKCRSLAKLPDLFGCLKSLRSLNLSECDKLGELCGNFHCLEELKELNLSGCCSLTKLPDSFGQLGCLELNLSGCCSLTKLPDSFGQLGCLEVADFQGCSNLAKLSDDFQTLPSLLRLNLSNCKTLGAEWMDRVGAIQSLLYVDISGSKEMTQQWIKMQTEKEEWHFVAVTKSSSYFYNHTPPKQWPSILEKIISKILKEGLLFDADQRPFYSSSLPSHVRLVLITRNYWWIDGVVQSLEYCSSEALKIIYVGHEFKVLPTKLADRIVAHSTSDSRSYSVMGYFRDVLAHYGFGVFASTIDVAERDTVKYLSSWEEISHNYLEIIARNPRDGNAELLRKLCETPENKFLLHKDKKVEVKDFEGKLVLLFRNYSQVEDKLKILALEDVYQKLQTSSDYRAEVVWIPRVEVWDDPREYLRAAERAPWPRVSNPWSIEFDNSWADCLRNGDGLVVVDEKGSISHKNAMTMILRWGIKAYPFSASREEELRETEWKEFNSSSQSSLEFIFQNLEHFHLKVREALLHGKMIFVCIGSINKMLEFLPQLNIALKKLEKVIQIFYVGEGVQHYYSNRRSFYEEEEEYEKKRNEMESVTSLTLGDAYKFWEHAKCLCDELRGKGVNKRIVQVRSMVLSFLNVCERRCEGKEGNGISIIAVDENGEMINGQAEEVVQLLCKSDEEEEHQKLMLEIKSEEFRTVLFRRRRVWRIHPKHDPHHPLIKLHRFLRRGIESLECDACGRCRTLKDYEFYEFYECSVCEKYKMCRRCLCSDC